LSVVTATVRDDCIYCCCAWNEMAYVFHAAYIVF